MEKREIRRREFLKGAAASAAGLGVGASLRAAESESAKIVNHNPRMGYRRLGKTGLTLSEISLGGHWKNRSGGRYWDTFVRDDVPADVAENRTEIVSTCIDCGINYLDITTAAECLSYGAALKGRREKMHVGADDHRLGPRNRANCTVEKLCFNVEECLRRLKTDYLDLWRVQADMGGGNTDAEVEVMIEAFEKVHRAGKARHFGISSHNRNWLKHIIEKYPAIEMVIFPCTARTKERGLEPTRENVVETGAGDGGHDETQSIFDAVRARDVGLVTIKPFAGGSLFSRSAKFPVVGAGSKKENELARLTLECILTKGAITATVPGMTTPYEVENNARASRSRKVGMSPQERLWLEHATDERFAVLPPEYEWLRDWDVV